MSITTTLPGHLLRAAKIFSASIKNAGGQSILIGGAATILLGQEGRDTSDLDFNLSAFNKHIESDLRSCGVSTKLGSAPNRYKANVPEVTPGSHDATSIDLAVKPQVINLLKYTKDIQGITVADEKLLLVDKIRSFTERAIVAGGKVENDMKDIVFCVLRLADRKEQIPLELMQMLDEVTMARFWERAMSDAGEDLGMCKEFFPEVGIEVPASLKH